MALAFTTDLTQPLLELADRFSCTIEMTTYLTMLLVGGPKRFFLWYCNHSWQVTGGEAIPSKFRASFSLCNDDLELALLLARVWFQSGSTDQEREHWARNWQINHKELINSVERKRDQMLKDLFFKKSDDEYVRPVDLRLMPKVRLLIAHHLVSLERQGAAQGSDQTLKGGICSATERQAVPIHQDSVCHGRTKQTFLYFFADSLADQSQGVGRGRRCRLSIFRRPGSTGCGRRNVTATILRPLSPGRRATKTGSKCVSTWNAKGPFWIRTWPRSSSRLLPLTGKTGGARK